MLKYEMHKSLKNSSSCKSLKNKENKDNNDNTIIFINESENENDKFKNNHILNCDIVNATLTPTSVDENKILSSFNEMNEMNEITDILALSKKENGTNTEMSTDDINDINYKIDKLFKNIEENKKKIATSIYIVSSKYDLIYFRYNKISLLILIISTITTFVEAIRLTLINYENDNPGSGITRYISKDTISLLINLFSLFLGTVLTILSSIVKFRNYRENMEKLKNIHDTLFNFKCLYNKQRDYIKFFTMTNNMTIDIFNKLAENVENINKEIKDISIFENIRINDIIKFNRIKVNHDIQLKELGNKRELEFLKLSIESTRNKKLFENENINMNDNFNQKPLNEMMMRKKNYCIPYSN
jgi:hypothetical protein